MSLRLRSFARISDAAGRPVPAPLRAPFGWPVAALASDAPLGSAWPASGEPGSGAARLRITTAVDDREDRVITSRAQASGTVLGTFALRHAPALTPCESPLAAPAAATARREGVVLTVDRGSRPLWLLAPGGPEDAAALTPHLLADGPRGGAPAFFDALASPRSLQPFGWMEGCVLDGLDDLHAATGGPRFQRARDAHLAAYFTSAGRPVYENPRGEVADGKIGTVEANLPFAVLARQSEGEHPLLELALEFWRDHTTAAGVIRDGDTLSTGGVYTVADPLAVVAGWRGDGDLARGALEQVRMRRARLWHDGALWLRCTDRDARTFRNWARGVAWYFLGVVRTAEALHWPVDTGELAEEARRMAEFVRRHQRPDGLWSCFLGEADTAADTSGSAGLAAALARGAGAGFLGEADRAAAARTWTTLLTRLTPDGLLCGAAPANRGGEGLQRSPRRVLSPMGMGLMGQLAAALPVEINLPPLLSISAHDGCVVRG